jgi:hypothetical protein
MVRANLKVMGKPAKEILKDYARRHGMSVEGATRQALGFIRDMERMSSRAIDQEAGFTPFLTFIGVKKPPEAVFLRAVSRAEHGKMPASVRVPRFSSKDLQASISREEARERARYNRFKTIQEIGRQMKKEERNLYKKPISKLEVMKDMAEGFNAGSRRYCTAYSAEHLKEVVNALEKKEVSPELLRIVAHEMREILDPHIKAETTIHPGADEKDRRIAKQVKRRLRLY